MSDTEPPLLTAEEVAELPEGAPITVTWSGGNGPHDYLVAVGPDGRRYAWPPESGERLRFYNPLRFVGVERFHTQVRIRREGPAS